MKKKWLLPILALCLLAGTQDGFAQRKKRNFKYGIRAGLNYSFLSGSNIEHDEGLYDYHVGGYLQFPISKNLIFEPGMNLSFKGYDAATVVGTKARDVLGLPESRSISKLRASFIDIPLVVKDNQSADFSPYAGLEFNFLMSQEHEFEYAVENEDGDQELVTVKQDLEDLRAVQTSALIGLEYHLSTFAHINISYGLALSSFDGEGDTDLKNNTLKLAVGFTF